MKLLKQQFTTDILCHKIIHDGKNIQMNKLIVSQTVKSSYDLGPF